MMKRFLSFIQQIKNSTKIAVKSLLNSIRLDTRSTTGSNLRNILLKTGKIHIEDLVPNDVLMLEYHPMQEQNEWKVPMILELIEIKQGQLSIPQFDDAEVDEIISFLCVSWCSPLSLLPTFRGFCQRFDPCSHKKYWSYPNIVHNLIFHACLMMIEIQIYIYNNITLSEKQDQAVARRIDGKSCQI